MQKREYSRGRDCQVRFRLSELERRKLDAIAALTGLSRSEVIRAKLALATERNSATSLATSDAEAVNLAVV